VRGAVRVSSFCGVRGIIGGAMRRLRLRAVRVGLRALELVAFFQVVGRRARPQDRSAVMLGTASAPLGLGRVGDVGARYAFVQVGVAEPG
jgi:hypothetical protein